MIVSLVFFLKPNQACLKFHVHFIFSVAKVVLYFWQVSQLLDYFRYSEQKQKAEQDARKSKKRGYLSVAMQASCIVLVQECFDCCSYSYWHLRLSLCLREF